MKKIIYLSLILLCSCSGGNSTQDKKTDLEMAEQYIEQMQPDKALPYLKKIESSNPDYKEAQELLSTIENVNKINPADGGLTLTSEEREKLNKVQNKWAKEQIKYYDGYFIDYTIVDATSVNFTLSKDASEVSTTQGHEEIHVPTLKSKYYEALQKNNIPNHPIEIHFLKSI